jgi:hypothetical protein
MTHARPRRHAPPDQLPGAHTARGNTNIRARIRPARILDIAINPAPALPQSNRRVPSRPPAAGADSGGLR